MSPKTRLGRNPFGDDSSGKPKAKKGRARKVTSARAHTERERVRKASRRRRTPPGFAELLNELTHYWIPRVRACVYVRTVKAFSRFA